MLARGPEMWSEAGRDEGSGSREEGAGLSLGAALAREAKLIRVTRRAVARIGPELHKLEAGKVAARLTRLFFALVEARRAAGEETGEPGSSAAAVDASA